MKDRPEYVLHLVAVADPNVRAGFPERDPVVRLRHALKLLLRGYGLKCTRAVPDVDPTPATPEAPPC